VQRDYAGTASAFTPSFLQQLMLRMPALRTQTEIMCRVGAQAVQVMQALPGAHAMQAMRHCVSCHQQRRHQLQRHQLQEAAPAAAAARLTSCRGGTSCSSSECSSAARGGPSGSSSEGTAARGGTSCSSSEGSPAAGAATAAAVAKAHQLQAA
jgi:hypothetical protein